METNKLVKVFNREGERVKFKSREKINKKEDIVHTIHAILIQSENVVLCKIPKRGHVYTAKFGSTVATMERKKESDEQAIYRDIKDDFQLDNLPESLSKPQQITERFFYEDDVLTRFFTGYIVKSSEPLVSLFDRKQIETVCYSQEKLDQKIEQNPDFFAPSFLAVWNRAQQKINELL